MGCNTKMKLRRVGSLPLAKNATREEYWSRLKKTGNPLSETVRGRGTQTSSPLVQIPWPVAIWISSLLSISGASVTCKPEMTPAERS